MQVHLIPVAGATGLDFFLRCTGRWSLVTGMPAAAGSGQENPALPIKDPQAEARGLNVSPPLLVTNRRSERECAE